MPQRSITLHLLCLLQRSPELPDLSLNQWQNILLALNYGESDSLLYSPGHLFAGGKAVENGYNVC